MTTQTPELDPALAGRFSRLGDLEFKVLDGEATKAELLEYLRLVNKHENWLLSQPGSDALTASDVAFSREQECARRAKQIATLEAELRTAVTVSESR